MMNRLCRLLLRIFHKDFWVADECYACAQEGLEQVLATEKRDGVPLCCYHAHHHDRCQIMAA